MTLNEALTYYADTLIIQYKTLDKARQTIQCLTNCSYCDSLPLQFSQVFDLDNAAGNQLTILGKIVGVPRNIFGLDLTHEFFNFTRYSGTPASIGFARWNAANSTYLISRWQTSATYTTTDFELRALIKLRIIYNNYYKSLGTVKNALYASFAGGIDVVDNLDYTLTFKMTAPYYNVGTICSYLKNIFPKPMGVGFTVTNV